MDETMDLLRQEEGVQLWHKALPIGGAFMIRTLRTRDSWHLSSETEATEIYEDEVAKSSACPHVQKKKASF